MDSFKCPGLPGRKDSTTFWNWIAFDIAIGCFIRARLGVDVGEDKPTSWLSESFARSSGLLKEHERIAPNIHGLAILPDDDHTRFPVINIDATVTADPEHFVSALRELGANGNICLGEAANGVRLLNLALMTSEPLAQMVLALSAVEELQK
jgi:hypothetical protein